MLTFEGVSVFYFWINCQIITENFLLLNWQDKKKIQKKNEWPGSKMEVRPNFTHGNAKKLFQLIWYQVIINPDFNEKIWIMF